MPIKIWVVGLKKVQSGFSEGKVIFSPYYFLICFKVLLGVKVSLKKVFRRFNMLSDLEKRLEKKDKEIR